MSDPDKQKSTGTASKNAKETVVISPKCPHTKDGAIKVAKYIVEEIKRNVKSIEAQRIRYYLTGEIGDKLQKSFDEIDKSVNKIIKTTGHTPHYGRPKTPSFTTALSLFYKQVDTDQPWDHKGLITGHRMRDLKPGEKLLGTPPKVALNQFSVHSPIRRHNLKSKKSISHYHKYKDYDYYFDVWSNIHYGYVGLSVGFSEDTLISGSDIQQFFENLGKGKFGADTPDDRTAIKIGFKLFKRFGKYAINLNYQDVLDILDSTPQKQFENTKWIHWCHDPINPHKVKK